MSEIAFRSGTELAAALRNKEISSRELLDIHLRRIDRYNPRINAVVTLDEEDATKRAREADDALARDEVWGPLHGLPMTIKDTFETAGMRTTSGSPAFAEHVPDTDADAVARLRAAGAVIVGKTNLPTFAMDFQSFNPVFGCTNNPWDESRSPGGSSGGSAAALAAGFTPIELGSDIGGSIRNPAHFCGIYSLKPTHGIVSMRGHIPGLPGTLSEMDIAVAGPMGRSAEDLALGLDVLAGAEGERAVAWRLQLPPTRASRLQDYRVAAWLDDPHCPVDSELIALMQAAVDAVDRAGARVDGHARPVDLADSDRIYSTLLMATGADFFPQEDFDAMVKLVEASSPDDDGPALRTARGITQRVRSFNETGEARLQMRARWHRFFEDHDVLLCPIVPTAAIPHNHEPDLDARTIEVNGATRPYMDIITWAGLTGVCHLPSVVAPIGRTAAGLPVGIQIVAPYLEDRTAIEFARLLAHHIGGFVPPPGLQDAG